MARRKVLYEGMGRMVTSRECDLNSLIPRVRQRETKEICDMDDMMLDDAVRFSYNTAKKRFSYLTKDGSVLVMAGVADLPSNSVMSQRLGIMDGKGGIPYLFSVEMATQYKFEIARKCAPIFLNEIKKGYDFLTIWVADYMSELYKLASFGGFRQVEMAVHPVSKTAFIRIAWHRCWGG